MEMYRDKLFSVYAIRCKKNGKVYIGRTTRLKECIEIHFRELRHSKHKNKALLDDFKKYGFENFEVYVLEENIPYSERMKEYEYMRQYNSFDEEFGYNRGDLKCRTDKTFKLIHALPPNKYQQEPEKEE